MVLRYKKVRDFQRAESLSQRICRDFPSSEQTYRIQLDPDKEQILQYISNHRYRQAEDAANSMAAAYGGNPAMAATLYRIGKEFKDYERYDEAIRISQRIAQDYPNSRFGKKAKMGVDKLRIWVFIRDGDVPDALAAMEKLIVDYGNESDLPHTVHGFARKLELIGEFGQAKTIYKRVRDDFADDWVGDISKVDVQMCDVRAMIGKADFSAVKSQLNAVQSQFAGHWHLPKAVREVGEFYRRKGMKLESEGSIEQARQFYRNSIEVWDMVIKLPHSSSTAHAWCWSGDSYHKLGDYTKAIDYYQEVIAGYPDYRFNSHSLFMIGQCYEELKRSGAVSQSQADTQIQAAYEQLVGEYLGSTAAEYAREWLGRRNSN